jgi:hypothetical protein
VAWAETRKKRRQFAIVGSKEHAGRLRGRCWHGVGIQLGQHCGQTIGPQLRGVVRLVCVDQAGPDPGEDGTARAAP